MSMTPDETFEWMRKRIYDELEPENERLRAELASATQEAERLKEALIRFGAHLAECPTRRGIFMCNCGFQDVYVEAKLASATQERNELEDQKAKLLDSLALARHALPDWLERQAVLFEAMDSTEYGVASQYGKEFRAEAERIRARLRGAK
jgi:hypothetical protein